MKGRWGSIVVASVALVALSLTAAGAQTPDTTAPTEGSVPPGGTVNCTTGATLDPPAGPPGTLVNVSAVFEGNCDEYSPLLFGTQCVGEVTGPGIEVISFPVTVNDTAEPTLTGQFTAPATEPDPPVVDAIETLAVTITCTTADPSSPPATTEGFGATTYLFPAVGFDLELFAENDGDQPTLVDNDTDVVAGSPTFTG